MQIPRLCILRSSGLGSSQEGLRSTGLHHGSKGTRADSRLTEAGTAIHGVQLVSVRKTGCVFEVAS